MLKSILLQIIFKTLNLTLTVP